MLTSNLTVENVLSSGSAAFGTSGLRGLVEDLTPAVIGAVVGGFLDLIAANHDGGRIIYLAHDLRPSSPKIAQIVCSVLHARGFDIVFAGPVPTPALALAARQAGAPCIMVTGSHIPFDRNGIKFYTADGEITKTDEFAILSANTATKDLDLSVILSPINEQVSADYLARFTTQFDGLLTGKRVGVYQHSAVGRDLNVEIFELLGAEVVPLDRSDKFVPVDTEAVDDADTQKCKAWVAEHNLDAVFSTDGDGDRPLLGDDTGHYFRGDVLGILAARYLGADAVATPVSSNTALEKSAWFGNTVRTKIGSPFVLAAMEKLHADGNGAVVGFEPNGGFLTQTDLPLASGKLPALPTRDALLPALAVMALAKQHTLRLSEVASLLPPRFTVSGRLQNRPVTQSNSYLMSLEANAALQNVLLASNGSVKSVDVTDGLRMTTEREEVIHLRPSGNAPEFRIYVEADSAERAETVLRDMVKRLGVILPEG